MKLFSWRRKPKVTKPRPAPIEEPEEITATRTVADGLSIPKSRELFEVIQTREVLPRLPDEFAGKNVAHLLFSGSPITGALRQKGAGHVLAGFMGRMPLPSSAGEGELRFRASLERLPLKEWCCRWVLVSAPTYPATPIGHLLRDVGYILEPGGQGVIMDWHPYSAAVRKIVRERPAIDEKEGIGLEKYFRAFKEAGLSATLVKEALVDGSLRAVMETEDEKKWYQAHRQEPLAIVLFVKKA